jgi:hypothetical protein
MTAEELLARLQSQGIAVARVGDRLRCTGPTTALTTDLVQAMREHKLRLLDLVAGPEVVWRLREMRRLLVPGRPLPYLYAVQTPFDRGQCLSCGEFSPQESRRCAPCREAVCILIEAMKQDGGRS